MTLSETLDMIKAFTIIIKEESIFMDDTDSNANNARMEETE